MRFTEYRKSVCTCVLVTLVGYQAVSPHVSTCVDLSCSSLDKLSPSFEEASSAMSAPLNYLISDILLYLGPAPQLTTRSQEQSLGIFRRSEPIAAGVMATVEAILTLDPGQTQVEKRCGAIQRDN